MMGFQVVILWSDILIWLLVAAGIGLGVLIARNEPLLAAWRRVGGNRVGMASATVLLAFIAIGLLDSLRLSCCQANVQPSSRGTAWNDWGAISIRWCAGFDRP